MHIMTWLFEAVQSIVDPKPHNKRSREFLVDACRSGSVEAAQWVHSIMNFAPLPLRHMVFCMDGTQVTQKEHLTDALNVEKRFLNGLLPAAVESGEMAMVTWVMATFPETASLKYESGSVLLPAIKSGSLEMVEWVCRMFGCKYGGPDGSVHRDLSHDRFRTCKPEIVVWIVSKLLNVGENPRHQRLLISIMQTLAMSDSIELLQTLHGLHPEVMVSAWPEVESGEEDAEDDIVADYEDIEQPLSPIQTMFTCAFGHGSTNVAKWLCLTFPSVAATFDVKDYVFTTPYSKNCLEYRQWVWSQSPRITVPKEEVVDAFSNAIWMNQIDCARWLWSLSLLNVEDVAPFKVCPTTFSVFTLEFLYDLLGEESGWHSIASCALKLLHAFSQKSEGVHVRHLWRALCKDPSGLEALTDSYADSWDNQRLVCPAWIWTMSPETLRGSMTIKDRHRKEILQYAENVFQGIV
jgi:hypothetical protein